MPKSVSYHAYLISRLKDPKYAALYIEDILSENNPEPELLSSALTDITKALSEMKMTSEQAKMHYDRLDELLLKRGDEAIYALANLLNAWGLKLTVAVCEDKKKSLITHKL